MMLMKIRLVAFFLILVVFIPPTKASPVFTPQIIQKINSTVGASDSVVNDIITDNIGRIWISTTGGIFIYDGREATQFLFAEKSFQDAFFYKFHLVGNDLYAGSKSGVVKINILNKTYQAIENTEDLFAIDLVVIDQFIYLGTQDDGLKKIDLISGKLFNLDISSHSASKSITNLETDSTGALWFSAYSTDSSEGFIQGGLFKLIDDTVVSAFFTKDVVITSLKMNNNFFYLSTVANGVIKFDPISEKDISHELQFSGFGNARDVAVDRNNCIWTAEMGGLRKTCSGNSVVYEENTSFLKSLDSQDFNKIFYDDMHSILWVGGYTGGVSGIYVSPNDVVKYSIANGAFGEISDNAVYAISKGHDGKLWVGLNGKGIDVIDDNFNKVKNIRINEEVPRANHVINIYKHTDGRTFVGTFGAGVWVSTDLGDNFVPFIQTENPSIQRSVVTGITEDKEYLWISTIREIYKVSYDGQILLTLPQSLLKDNGLFYHIEVLNDQELIIASSAGAIIVNKQTLAIQYPNEYAPEALKCHSSTLHLAKESASSYIFVADELCRIDTMTKTLDQISDSSETKIGSQAVMTTSKGEYVTASDTISFINRDGLISNIDQSTGFFLKGSPPFKGCLVEFSNHIVAATPKGLIWIELNNNLPKRLPLGDISIESLRIMNNQTDDLNKITKSGLTLEYNNNFVVLDMVFPEYFGREIEYTADIKGLEEQQINLPRLTSFMLPVGQEGAQTVKINARLDDKPLSSLVLNYTVLPPWWRTSQFLTLCFAGLLLIFWFIYRVRLNEIAKKNKLLERKIDERTFELQQTINDKQAMFENISHEFRTPLTFILGKAENLQKSDIDTVHKSHISIIYKQAHRLYELVENLLKLAEMRAVEKQKRVCKPAIELKELLHNWGHLADEKQIEIHFESSVSDELQVVLIEETLFLVAGNIIGNAIKYNPTGTQIHIAMSQQHGNIIIIFSDEGPGFKNIDNVFERFSRESNVGSGNGLGLAIVKHIVEQNKGSITLENIKPHGAKISVSLPLIEGPNDVQQPVSQDEDESIIDSAQQYLALPQFPANSQILLVEDNDDLRQYLISLLQPHISIHSCIHGQEALTWLEQHSPDLILSDVMMPEMDGYELCAKIKQHDELKHIPFILLTAKSDLASQKKGLALQADDYIAKPFSSDVLLAKLANTLQTLQANRQKWLNSIVHLNAAHDEVLESTDNKLLSAIQTHLNSHYTDCEYSASDLAGALNMSEKTLNRRLNGLLSTSFSKLLREYRLERAHEKLQRGGIPSIVCFDCGFSSQAYFGKCFKEKYYVSPSQICML